MITWGKDQMRRMLTILSIAFALGELHAADRYSASELVFLTRSGCVNTTLMHSRLDEALRSLKFPTKYTLIDLDKLDPSDRRRGYPTPTVLYVGRDLFGLAAPSSSTNAPS